MNTTDYKMCIRVLNQTAHVALRAHVYECVILVRVTHVSDACHTRLTLNLSPVCTVASALDSMCETAEGAVLGHCM